MDKIIRGEKISYWKDNAKDNYNKTPISVLKYITILEEALDDSNKSNDISRIISESDEPFKKLSMYDESIDTIVSVSSVTDTERTAVCDHSMVVREYTSQPYGHCMLCGKTVFAD